MSHFLENWGNLHLPSGPLSTNTSVLKKPNYIGASSLAPQEPIQHTK